MKNNIQQKSFAFAVRIVKLCKVLRTERREYTLSNQLLRSGTSIGANVTEAQQAQSRADFLSKLNIALKEASETEYWLRLLEATDYLTKTEFESIYLDCDELIKILVSSVRSIKN
ncbi:MAG: four helix bundle protein [Ruminococcaceae bacterium]|nr:four helix bundle protein [Oscillospiraceae bacterium]